MLTAKNKNKKSLKDLYSKPMTHCESSKKYTKSDLMTSTHSTYAK